MLNQDEVPNKMHSDLKFQFTHERINIYNAISPLQCMTTDRNLNDLKEKSVGENVNELPYEVGMVGEMNKKSVHKELQSW